MDVSAEMAKIHAVKRRDHALAAYEAGAEAAERARVLDLREAEIEAAVAAEQDADGKPLYSNADKRKAEVAVRLASDPDVAAMREGIEYSKKAAAQQNIDAQFRADMVRIACAFAQSEVQ